MKFKEVHGIQIILPEDEVNPLLFIGGFLKKVNKKF